MREVWREAQHRRDLAGFAHRLHHRGDVTLVVAGKELVVVFDAFAAERGGIVDPLHVAALTSHELVEVALGKDGDSGCRHSPVLQCCSAAVLRCCSANSRSYQFGGAPTGYCSRSITA